MTSHFAPEAGLEGLPVPHPAEKMEQTDRRLLEFLVCPVSKGPLHYDAERQELVSKRAGLVFPIRNGVPMLTVDSARSIDGG